MTDEQRAERLRYHMYESNEGILEHAERIVALEELVLVLWHCADECGDCDACELNGKQPPALNEWLGCDGLRDRMAALGIEVKG